jgi:hypothetical protein
MPTSVAVSERVTTSQASGSEETACQPRRNLPPSVAPGAAAPVIAALAVYRCRYAKVAELAGLGSEFAAAGDFEVVE